MVNSVLCVKCGKWIPWKISESKEGDLKVGGDFVCARCKNQVNGLVELVEELCEEVEW